ncbi:GNAT family N-acetyltransferase [bacterium]|nr:GNAT family N-acetyltransferase [bacterium]
MHTATKQYPKWVQCRGDFAIEIRPLRADQIGKHMEFLHALDEQDLAKLPCDVKDVDYPSTLRDQMKANQVKRVVAWYGLNEIVGSLVLYPGTNRWTAHTANVVVATHPDYRRFGVATALCDEIVPFAKEMGVSHIYAHLSDFHREGTAMLKKIGFRKEATLPEHVRDANGEYHTLYIYGMKLKALQEAMVLQMAGHVRLDHRV